MLLRLRIKNFKSLKDIDVQFGPFTCFVGPNGVGKSNVFDAIQFLRALTEDEIQKAAQSVRSPATGAFGPLELFSGGNVHEPLEFIVDMLVPREVVDDFGRTAKPATTLLRYRLALRYTNGSAPRLEIADEELVGLKAGEAKETLGFAHSQEFRTSAFTPTRRIGKFISATNESGQIKLMLHQDGGSRGQPIPAGHSPRTVVGGTNAAEYPTVLAARREMASWQLLHLEPSIMRTPDQFGGPSHVSERGGHIAASLARLVASREKGDVLQEAANRLAALVPDVCALTLDRDESRQQLSVQVRLRGSNLAHGPRALSDGTLRFLALVTLLLDPKAAEVLCMEEPENGIHPGRIPAAVSLLRDFAVDPRRVVDDDNPLRQVVLNTHSPDVVRQLATDEVLFVDSLEGPGGRVSRISPVGGRWRSSPHEVQIQRLIDFIGGAPVGAMAEELQSRLAFGTAG